MNERKPRKVLSPAGEHLYTLYWNATHNVWFAHYWLSDGHRRTKQVPVSEADEESALRWLERWYADVQRTGNVRVQPKEEPATLRSIGAKWADYMGTKPGAKPDGKQAAESLFRDHVLPHRIANIPLDRLRLADWIAWLEWLRTKPTKKRPKGLAPYTVRNLKQRMSCMWSDAQKKGWIDERWQNPLKHDAIKSELKGAEPRAGAETIIVLSEPDVRRILHYSGDRVSPNRHARNILAVTTGMRKGELCGLRWSDLREDRAHVERQLVGAYSTKEAPVFAPPKKKSYRVIPLHPLTRKAMERWRTEWEAFVGRLPQPEDPVFPDRDGDFVYNEANEAFRTDLLTYGIPHETEEGHPLTFHALRRTFLTMLTDANVPDGDVKVLAGHKAAGVTRKHYVAKTYDRLASAIARLPLEVTRSEAHAAE